MDKIEEALTEYFGERCPDYHKECVCCKAWKEYDDMHEEYFKKLNTAIERLEKLRGYK